MPVRLVVPSLHLLPEYTAALKSGWSSTTNRTVENTREELQQIDEDPGSFIASLDDPEARGAPIALPDGSFVPRLPGYRRWISDGDFCGSINIRWQPGTSSLPPHVLGHIGYGIIPWKRGRGYAARALALLLPEAKKIGLPYVELTTEPENIASQKTILSCGGILIERFKKDKAYGDAEGSETLRYRIELSF